MSKSSGLPDGFENLDADNQIDVVCDRFEEALLAGRSPRIEAYLEYVAEPLRKPLLIELFGLEIDYRRERDDVLDFSEYASRFPRESRMLWRHFCDEFDSNLSTSDATVVPGGGQTGDLGRAADATAFHPSSPDYRRIGRYVLDRVVRRGTEGDLWRGFDPQLNREVRVLLSGADSSRDVLLAQLQRARKATYLRHPGIVGVCNAGEEDGHFYAVMEAIDGQPLRDWLSQQPPPGYRRIVELVRDVADALAAAHANGVLHQNVSPDQIVVDRAGRARLDGFAIDSWAACDGDVDLRAGRAAYRAPEQFAISTSDVGAHTDVYALGVVLYELLSGHRPFQGSVHEVAGQILTRMLVPLWRRAPDVPEDLAAICSKAMAQDPAERYSSADAFAADLRRFLEGKTPRASRASCRQRIWRSMRQHPLRWMAMLLVATGVVTSAAGLIWDDGHVRVQIVTTPEGAEVTYIPLGADDGLPRPEQAVRATGDRIMEARLPPGDYLVVAVVDGYGFHEVLRRVPHPGGDEWPGPYEHQRWALRSGGLLQNDIVLLPPIDVPDAAVVDGMVLVETVDAFSVGDDHDGLTMHMRPIRDFYLDPTELSWGEYTAVMDELPPFLPASMHSEGLDPQHAVCYVTFDQAVALAERLGKRLPDEFEYEYVATHAGTRSFPWGDESGAKQVWTYGAVGDTGRDLVILGEQPPIAGLYSNVAEWTSSLYLPYPGATDAAPDFFDPNLRVVRGGPWSVIQGEPDATEARIGPRERIGLPRESARRGLGVRFARSVVPRLRPEHFSRPADDERGG